MHVLLPHTIRSDALLENMLPNRPPESAFDITGVFERIFGEYRPDKLVNNRRAYHHPDNNICYRLEYGIPPYHESETDNDPSLGNQAPNRKALDGTGR